VRILTLKNVPLDTAERPTVDAWTPGLRNVPLDVRMGSLKGQLARLGLVLAPQGVLQSGLLTEAWNGFPRHALVIWAGAGQDGNEWMAVSEEPAQALDEPEPSSGPGASVPPGEEFRKAS
jgi:hypothetical protein